MKRTPAAWIAAAALALLATTVPCARAQEVSLDIQPRIIRLNETATLKLTFLNLNPQQAPAMPDIPGFTVQYTGQESHFQILNGRHERRLTFNYRMAPRSTGKFQIGPFTMNFGGSDHVLDPIGIEVLPPSGNRNDGGQETIDDLVFARVLLPRERVYLHERFDVELALYYRGVQLDRGIQPLDLPATGINFDNWQELGSTRESVDNEIYTVRRFRMRATAISAGTIELAPKVRVHVLVRRERPRDPFFGGLDSFFGLHDSEPLLVSSEPKTVEILPLPAENRPANFGGAVGQFSMDLDVRPTEVNAGDPITLTLRITGRGNFETISMPPLQLGDQFRQYDPKLIAASDNHKIFEQVFIPRSDKITELPPVSFSYFDPEAGAYQSIVKPPVPLTVRAGEAGSLQVVQAPSELSAAARDPLGIDIIDIKRTAPAWVRNQPPAPPDASAVALHVAPVLALALGFIIRRRQESIRGDVSRRRRSLAPKSARASIRKAEHALTEGNRAAFYGALWQALADYVGHRANLEPGEVSPDLIMRRVQAGHLADDYQRKLQAVMAACDEVRFGGGGDAAADRAMLNNVQDILKACERIAL